MKKEFFLLLLLSFLALPLELSAQDSTQGLSSSVSLFPDYEKTLSFVEFSLSFHEFDYKEDLPIPQKSTESGFLAGGRISFHFQKNIYLGASLDITPSDTDYIGTTQSGMPVKDITENIFITERNLIGYDILAHTKGFLRIYPYLGLGVHYWERRLGGAAPYKEVYSWGILPIGIRTTLALTKKWLAILDFSAQIMFGGEIEVFLSELDPSYRDVTMDLGNRVGFRGEITVVRRFLKHLGGIFSFWIEYIEIGKSNAKVVFQNGAPTNTVIYEPSSRSWDFGFNIGLLITF
ncbi:MAG: hypothetical protein D6785_02555 [Planctomycetota bacterium]|nr:MAG: hypothetical protein D6785_02555 [Planctomycetota bacterium]